MAELYAISDDIATLQRLAQAGVRYVQLRIKGASFPDSVSLPPDTKLIVNDSLQAAERLGAWGVHLGQEDLKQHNPQQLEARSVRLGISTHNELEIEQALQYNPDYIAFGPIFETATKRLAYAPQGLARLKQVVEQVPLPVVAIGGISPKNCEAILNTGVAAVASISAMANLTPQELQDWVVICRSAAERLKLAP